VEGRDFVAERLSHEERVAQEWYQLSFRRYLRMQELFEIGVVEARDLAEADVAAREAEGQLDLLALRSRMRHEFLAGELTAEAAELGWEAREAEANVQVLEGVLESTMEELRALEERVEAGMVRDAETRQARLELLRTELELDMARLRLQQLRSGGGEDPDS
jgi:hypothetical protein